MKIILAGEFFVLTLAESLCSLSKYCACSYSGNIHHIFGAYAAEVCIKLFAHFPLIIMSSQTLALEIDELLQPYLAAKTAEEADRYESHLLQIVANEIIQKILGNLYGIVFEGKAASVLLQEAEDARGEIHAKLLGLLRKCKQDPWRYPVHRYRGLVAIVTYRVFFKRLRSQNHEYTALKKRLRRLLKSLKYNFALWLTTEKKWACGFSRWRESMVPLGTTRPLIIQQFLDDPTLIALRLDRVGRHLDHKQLAEVVRYVFQQVGSPVELKDLMSVVTKYESQFYDSRRTVFTALNDSTLETFVVTGIDQQTLLEAIEYLRHKWKVILSLRPRQRLALLLKMNGPSGLEIYLNYRISDDEEVSRLLEMDEVQYEEFMGGPLWRNEKIGLKIGATAVEVSNLRKTAKEFMSRHLAHFDTRNI